MVGGAAPLKISPVNLAKYRAVQHAFQAPRPYGLNKSAENSKLLVVQLVAYKVRQNLGNCSKIGDDVNEALLFITGRPELKKIIFESE